MIPYIGSFLIAVLIDIAGFSFLLTSRSTLYLQITPPFKPQVESDTDTRYFDSEFTGESVELTPPENAPLDSITEEPASYFTAFSYQDSPR